MECCPRALRVFSLRMGRYDHLGNGIVLQRHIGLFALHIGAHRTVPIAEIRNGGCSIEGIVRAHIIALLHTDGILPEDEGREVIPNRTTAGNKDLAGGNKVSKGLIVHGLKPPNAS